MFDLRVGSIKTKVLVFRAWCYCSYCKVVYTHRMLSKN